MASSVPSYVNDSSETGFSGTLPPAAGSSVSLSGVWVLDSLLCTGCSPRAAGGSGDELREGGNGFGVGGCGGDESGVMRCRLSVWHRVFTRRLYSSVTCCRTLSVPPDMGCCGAGQDADEDDGEDETEHALEELLVDHELQGIGLGGLVEDGGREGADNGEDYD
eukprot:2543802-Rhodomonas_salina.1